MRAVVLALLILATAASGAPAAADAFEEGCEAFDRGDFEAAMQAWQPLAEQGHAQAQFRLGCLYTYGQGTKQDHARALELYRAAAEQGDPDAQNNLGSMYALGWGTEADPVEAYMWLELAARGGHAMATSNRAFLEQRMSPDEIEEAVARAEQFIAGRATN